MTFSQFATQGTFELFLLLTTFSKGTGRVLLTDERNRRRYGYPDVDVIDLLPRPGRACDHRSRRAGD